jgi:hypothetical protein
MKNYDHLMEPPAVPSRQREEAEAAESARRTIRKCDEEGVGAVFWCADGIYGYVLPFDCDDLDEFVPFITRLLLIGHPGREFRTAREMYEANLWDDYENDKKLFAKWGKDLDSLEVGYVTVPEEEEVSE